MPKSQLLVINGWTILAHPLFLEQLEELAAQVEDLRLRDPQGYGKKSATKRLAAIYKLAFHDIPQDPTNSKYRQDNALGDKNKHWFRAKFFQQHRLFFRYHQKHRIILLVWINDESTKRAYESDMDAYKVFRKMLDSGNPPDSWDDLCQDANRAAGRLQKAVNPESPGQERDQD